MRPLRRLSLSAALVLAASAFVGGTPTVSAATASPVFGNGTPDFINSAAPADFSGATFAGEPSIGVNWRTGAAMYMAGTSTARLTFNNAPGANPVVTWTDVSSPYSLFNLDPILATDHSTGTTLAGGDNGACAVMSKTTTDGGFFDTSAWTPSVPCPFTADHPTVGMGPYVGTPPAGAAPFITYFCQQTILDHCSHSTDGGVTWSPSVLTTTCAGTFGHIKVSPDGTAYLPNVNCNDTAGDLVVGAMTSVDNGQSWGGYGIPGAPEPTRGFDPSIGTLTDSNRVFETWSRADDYRPVVTWSDDHGASWAPQVDLSAATGSGVTAATFEAAVGGDHGRMAIAYLGTRDVVPAGTTPFDAGFPGVWYLFVSYTYDNGATWQTVQATPQPVQRGQIDDGGTAASGQRNLLDFIDASVTKDGRVVVAYADGCIDADPTTGANCNAGGTSADSNADYATVAYQQSGQGLFSAYDVSVPSASTLTATSSATAVALSWTTPAANGSPITGYQLMRGTASGGETLLTTLPAGSTSYADTSAADGSLYYYRVAAVNAVGAGRLSNEVTGSATTVPAAPTLTATGGKAQVSLSWTTPSDGGAPITGWTIYRSIAPGAEQLIQTISSGSSYVDNTVVGGTTYYYEVAAINRNGTGALSREASATPKRGK